MKAIVTLVLFLMSLLMAADAPRMPDSAETSNDHLIFLPMVSTPQPPPVDVPFGQTFRGEGTFYAADGSGNCSFDPSPDDMMVAAMNEADYNNAAYCGAYANVTGPSGTVMVRIVDRCPGCAQHDLDLSPQAFEQIADLSLGRVPITWQLVSPSLDGPIRLHFKDSSNPWWAAVQVRNHRTPIARMEFLDANDEWVDMPRAVYNYFVAGSGMGTGPFTLRVTDTFGRTITEYNVPLLDDAGTNGMAQFPPPP